MGAAPRTDLAASGRIKGAAFREFITWWETTRGRAAWDQALSTLPDDQRRIIDPTRPALGVLPSVWYDAPLVHALCDAIMDHIVPGTLQVVAEEGAQVVMDRTIRGIYRAAFRMLAKPSRYPRYVQRIWNMHYDSGTVDMYETAPGEHTNDFRDWHAHHPLICRLNLASAVPIYTAMGCRQVEYRRTQCVSDGAACCQSVVQYR